MSNYNIELAKKVIESCENPPDGFEFDMLNWGKYNPERGTAMCLAGWTVYHGIESIKDLVDNYKSDRPEQNLITDPLKNLVAVIARDLLLPRPPAGTTETDWQKYRSACFRLSSIFYHDESFGDTYTDEDSESAAETDFIYDRAAHLQAFKEFFGLA